MTPTQQARYERDLRIWEYRKKNPDILLDEIASMFGLFSGNSIGSILRRMDKHINHGEPYLKPLNPNRNKQRTGMKYNVQERLDFRTTKNPESYWAQSGVRF